MAALVSRQGSIDWCCFPRFDSPSYFARLLDPSGGHFSLTPTQPFESQQSYLNGTNVIETRFVTASGSARLTDLVSVKEPEIESNRLWPDEEILRIVEADSGEVEFELEFKPRTQFGKGEIHLRRIGIWGIKDRDGTRHFLLQSTLPHWIGVHESHVQSRFKIRAGERVILSLSYSDDAPAVAPSLDLALKRRDQTVSYWRNWSSQSRYNGLHREWVERSALALKLLNFAPSGAFVAAATTSLPEWIGGSRNWDYRFCWLRDASFTTRALIGLGYEEEATAFLNWLLHSTRLTWPRLQTLYSVYGESKIGESIAPWLSGFHGSRPVRIGNEASQQVQLDVYGEVIDSFYALSERWTSIDRETQRMVIGFGKAVADLWQQPDHGIWEFRRAPRHYTHSKLMCWVAMDRLTKLAHRHHWRLPFSAGEIAFKIRAEIESRGYHPLRGAYTRSYGEEELDASLLVMPLVGYCAADDPRYVSTRDEIIAELSCDDLVYRYPWASDGFAEPEGAFTLCNFWLAESFAMSGELEKSKRWWNAAVRSATPTGLLTEEIDPQTGEPLGNFPQGFSHIGLIHAAMAMDRAQPRQTQTPRESRRRLDHELR